MNKNYKVAFYDWDGCIAQTLGIWVAASKKVLAEEDIYPKDSDIVQYFGNWKALQLLGHNDLGTAIERFLAHLRIDLREAKLYPQVAETIQSLCEKGIKIAIISTSRRESIEATPMYKSINDCVEFFITAEDVIQHKPAPESIENALSMLNAKPSQAVIVGDSDKDIKAAHNAGIDSILFAPEEHKLYYDLERFKALGPTHCITNHKAVLNII